jgi:hypothetical protein
MAFGATIYSGQASRGVDRQITIRRNDTGAMIQIGGRLASIEWSDKDTVEEIDGIDNGGRVDHIRYAGGITGTVSVNRYNGDYETLSKWFDSNFYAGGVQTYCTITETTNNGYDMSVNTDTFTYCVLGKLKSGPFQNKTNAKVAFEFSAQERI